MGTCGNCGARLGNEVLWCTNCHQPVPEAQRSPDAPETGKTAQPAEEERPLSPPGTVIAAPPRVSRAPRLEHRETIAKAEFSRWRQGPTSFGPVTKVILTIGILAFAPVGGFAGFTILFSIPYVPIAGLLLWGLWRKQQVG